MSHFGAESWDGFCFTVAGVGGSVNSIAEISALQRCCAPFCTPRGLCTWPRFHKLRWNSELRTLADPIPDRERCAFDIVLRFVRIRSLHHAPRNALIRGILRCPYDAVEGKDLGEDYRIA
eukprot:5243130-Amphidinium_carterae.1